MPEIVIVAVVKTSREKVVTPAPVPVEISGSTKSEPEVPLVKGGESAKGMAELF